MLRQRVELDQWDRYLFGIEPGLRFGTITGCDRAKPQAWNPCGKSTRHDPADGAKARDCDRN
jgi:hypothetical protein